MSANQLNIYQNNGNVYSQPIATKQIDPFQSLTSPNFGYPFPDSSLIQLQPRKVTFSTNTLGITTHVYTSPSYDDITALAQYFADFSAAYEIQEGPTHSITVSVPWDTMTQTDFNISLYASENWEIVETMDTRPLLMQGLLSNPFTTPTGTNYIVLPDILKVAVQRALDNKTSIALTANSPNSASLAPYFPFAQQSLNYLRAGIEGTPSYTQTLKRTAVIDKNNSNGAFNLVADSDRNNINQQGSINFIYSSGDLINNYSIPRNTVAKFMLPSYSKNITISGLDPIQYVAYAGWLVKPPSIQFIGRNKLQLTQEFIWNEWIQGLYYIYSPQSSFPLIN